MATPTAINDATETGGSVKIISWPLTTADATGGWVEFTDWADRTWQAVGTWGGATLAFEGSNDGSNSFPLTNVATGAAATMTADGGQATIELPRYARPKLTTAGSGATISVTVCARRAQPLRA